MIVYKIRRKSDGKFSTGGGHPSFTKNGKIWKQKGHLTSHLNQVAIFSKQIYLNECEIVPFELIEQPAGPSMSISTYLTEIQDRKDKRKADFNARFEAHQKEQRRLAFEKLKQEFGDD